MGKLGFCSEVSSLIFPFYSQEKNVAFVIMAHALLQWNLPQGIARNLTGATILIALAKTIYNGKRQNVTPVDFENLRGAA